MVGNITGKALNAMLFLLSGVFMVFVVTPIAELLVPFDALQKWIFTGIGTITVFLLLFTLKWLSK